jgi:hypothetical protein
MRAIAFDLGASSGRAILGTLEAGRLTLEELHRFGNTPVQLPTGLYWDTLRLFLIGLPALLAGTWLGLKLYGRLDEAAFRKVVLIVLLVSGIALML